MAATSVDTPGAPAAATADRLQAVFVDRDGVINENRAEHVKRWSEFRFLPGAFQALARLARAGIKVFVVTNQSIVNRGLISRAEMEALNRKMVGEIEQEGGRIVQIAYCPHRPDEHCECRKPRPGLLLELAQSHRLDLRKSAMIGDAIADVQAALAVGCKPILVLTGRGESQLALASQAGITGFDVVPDLAAATELLLGQGRAQNSSGDGA